MAPSGWAPTGTRREPEPHVAFGHQTHLRTKQLDGRTQARIAANQPGEIDAQDEWHAT